MPLARVSAAEKAAAELRAKEWSDSKIDSFKADIAARRLAGQAERERHRTFVDSFNYAKHRAPMQEPVKHSPCTKPRSLVYPVRGWRHKSHVQTQN